LVASYEETPKVIPVLGFCTLKRFDLADRLLASIDYPIEHLVVVDNSGLQTWTPTKPDCVSNLWTIRVPFGLGLVGAWNLIVKSTPYAPYWVLVNDDAYFEAGALETIAKEVDTEALNFLDIVPQWSAVVFGEGMIDRVGLYDERFYPLYFDDNDLERRVDQAGVAKKTIQAKVHHDNSSTLNSGFAEKNAITYSKNARLMDTKVSEEDYSQGEWSLAIRRANRWD
jgi:GT2 family glycosyltransferase